MASDAYSTRISVLGGIHDGAESSLAGQQIAIIGSADDCDLRLVDAGVAAHHLALGVSGDDVTVRPMDGKCAVNAKPVRPGQCRKVSDGDRVALHGTEVRLTLAVEPGTRAARDQRPEPRQRPRAIGRRPWLVPAAAVLIFTGAALSAQQLRSADAPPPGALQSVNAVLETLDFATAVTVSNEPGGITLRGILPEASRAELDRAIRQLPHDVVNRTQSVSRLLEQVSSVFRTNGYHAELNYVGGGAVQVTNLDAENPKIRQVAAYARDDVAALTALTFAAPAGRAGKRLAVYPADPNKRLTTIIDGDTAYVATTDGGRYFVGSVLPGGLVLRNITADGIQVDDNGEIHWLAL